MGCLLGRCCRSAFYLFFEVLPGETGKRRGETGRREEAAKHGRCPVTSQTPRHHTGNSGASVGAAGPLFSISSRRSGAPHGLQAAPGHRGASGAAERETEARSKPKGPSSRRQHLSQWMRWIYFHLILKLSHLCILHTHRGRGCNLSARK